MKVLISTVTALAIGAAAVFVALRGGGHTWDVADAVAADNAHVAAVRGEHCEGGACQSLWIGTSPETLTRVATLPPVDRCTEVLFTPDGRRAAFLINGYELRFYDAGTLSGAGVVKLVEPDGVPPSRIARGVTFSENGRAVTFDDCPRRHSGCRAGLAGVPR